MTPGDWIALGGLFLTLALALVGVVYRLGGMDTRLQEISRRLGRIEDKQDAIGQDARAIRRRGNSSLELLACIVGIP